jgi:hypothetical protein
MRQVVDALGAPANWTTKPDGTSQLGYNYVQKEPGMFRRIKEARFAFDQNPCRSKQREESIPSLQPTDQPPGLRPYGRAAAELRRGAPRA